MICQVIRNKKNEIETILAPNGKESILYKDLLKITNIKEDAFKLWTKVYTPTFKSWFGDWLDNPQSVKNLDDNGEPKLQGTYYVNSNGETHSVLTNQDTIKPNEVGYMLRAVNILQSDKAQEIFNKGEKNNWSLDKILSDLQIPKEQKDLILNSGKTNREDILLDLAANYSYTIEINTAKEGGTVGKNQGLAINEARSQGLIYGSQEFNDFVKNYVETKGEKYTEKPTQYYSNLTVPGGTNYTEQEIATPAITPAIKGHAQFATDNGIGWFRSDDLGKSGTTRIMSVYDKGYLTPEERLEALDYGETDESIARNIEKAKSKPTALVTLPAPELKTRRILEVQSDLFQKWRNNFEFEGNKYTAKKDDKNVWHYYKNGNEINSNEYTKTWEIFLNTYLDNADAFTKLLQKDNNWVTFFVKSIIQDTAKQTITEVQESDVEAKVKELEKDGLLEIDCKGKLKAEKGLQTNFTKGGEWKLIKDLKGYPTHKEGGVDLIIGKDGVSIKNGNAEFTARHGLVIPKN